MGKVKIGGVSYDVAGPADLDDALIAATGCASGEVDRLIDGPPHLAEAALRPFLDKPPAVGVLAAAISADADARAVIRDLYASVAPTPAGKATNEADA